MKHKTLTSVLILFALASTVSCGKDDTINFNDSATYETFTDPRDGKEYRIVTIGNQTWFAENLNYNPEKCDGCEVYARFYRWGQIDEVVPDGWHLPSEVEVRELIEYLGGSDIAGGKLKETGTNHWNSPNTNATNSSGFTALPAGVYESQNGSCYYRKEEAYFWISDSTDDYYSKFLVLTFDTEAAFFENPSNEDLYASIRLVRD